MVRRSLAAGLIALLLPVAALAFEAVDTLMPSTSGRYPAYPLARMLNPAVSPRLEAILSKALMEDREYRYQSYAEMKRDLMNLL